MSVIAVLVVVASVVAVPRSRAEPGLLVFPLRVHQLAGRVVEREAWLDEEIRTANSLWEPHGLSFVIGERVTLDTTLAVFENGPGPDPLVSLRAPSFIDVFVVLEIIDPDATERHVAGACRSHDERYVVVSVGQDDYVLAHELGHYFGLHHTSDPANLMWPHVADRAPAIDATQVSSARATATERAMRHEPAALSGL